MVMPFAKVAFGDRNLANEAVTEFSTTGGTERMAANDDIPMIGIVRNVNVGSASIVVIGDTSGLARETATRIVVSISLLMLMVYLLSASDESHDVVVRNCHLRCTCWKGLIGWIPIVLTTCKRW